MGDTLSKIIPAVEKLPKTLFGEMSNAELTPIVQISAQYGLEEDLNIVESNGGSHLLEGSMYKITSGTNALGLASLNSKKQLNYKPGQGLVGRFTALFDTPVPNSLQAAGLITSEDALTFGYLGETFGIIRGAGGVVEAQELTITIPAAGAENATITINGTPYTVALTAGTVQHNCWEIAEDLTSQVDNYLFSSNDDTVYVMAQIPGLNGSFSFSSATAVGSFVQQVAGVDIQLSIIPQGSWNGGIDTSWLDQTKGNVYEIKFGYLGFSAIEFYLLDPETNDRLLVHTLQHGNQNTTPIVRNPTFRIGWVVRNLGNTTSLTVQGASAMGANEGVTKVDTTPRGIENTQTGVGTTQTNILTVRNRFHFGDIINRAPVKPLLLSFSTDSTKSAFFEIYSGASFGGDLDYEYIDRGNSVLEYAKDSVSVAGGRFIASFVVTNAGLVISSEEFQTRIEPDQYITISAAVTSGSASEMNIAVSLQEDL